MAQTRVTHCDEAVVIKAQREGMTESLALLYDQAIARFGARCLWNAAPPRSVEGLLVVADRLRRYGGMDAWRLAAAIRAELDLAAR
jgi:hypothetical protein